MNAKVDLRTAELVRTAARDILERDVPYLEEMHEATRVALPQALRDDPVIDHHLRVANRANAIQWLSANVVDPAAPVEPCLGESMIHAARDMARRGISPAVDMEGWRHGQEVAWQGWVETCLKFTNEPGELVPLLSVSHASLAEFAHQSVNALHRAVSEHVTEIGNQRAVERLEIASLLISGAPVPISRAETVLGHRLTGMHVGVIAWVQARNSSKQLDAAAERLMRATGCRSRITVAPDASTMWIWLALESLPDLDPAVLLPGVRLALGRPAAGIDGFRKTHQEALVTQQVAGMLRASRRLYTYDDVQLASVLAIGSPKLELFVHDVLGPLETADPVLRETVLVFAKERFNAARTAERLFTHRNTVERRIKRAESLLPQPIAERAIEIAVALQLVQLRS